MIHLECTVVTDWIIILVKCTYFINYECDRI